MTEKAQIITGLKEIVVTRLGLKLKPEEIKSDQPLFGSEEGGLGLDSIEALELVVGIEEKFGVLIQDEDDVVEKFYSIDTLGDLVAELIKTQHQ